MDLLFLSKKKEVNMNKRVPRFFGIHAVPSQWLSVILLIIPFLVLLIIYLIAADIRHRENPKDKFVPTIGKMIKTTKTMAFSKDRRTEKYLLLDDTLSTLKRLGIGILISSVVGFLLGLNMGIFPGVRNLLLPFVTFISNVPPLAILPILFIIMGQGDFAKIMLIAIGTFTPIARDICFTVTKIPKEMITKAETLGASQVGVTYRVIMPQIMPRLLEDIRLQLGAAWLFLIAAEAVSAESGLGYRIFLVIRYLSMDKIIPYVLWITIIAWCFDFILKKFTAWKYPWYNVKREN